MCVGGPARAFLVGDRIWAAWSDDDLVPLGPAKEIGHELA
jgi:hypothetical protein